MGIYVKFTKTTHQIWSCHVTLASNSEKFYFSTDSVSNFRKSYQICGKLTQEQKSYRQKTNWGWKTPPPPPVLIGLRFICSSYLAIRSALASLRPIMAGRRPQMNLTPSKCVSIILSLYYSIHPSRV